MIRDTKFKHEFAIKLIKIPFERANRSSEDWSSSAPIIFEILMTAASSGTNEILQIFFFYSFYPPAEEADIKSLVIATIKNRQDKVFNFLLRNFIGFCLFISHFRRATTAILKKESQIK